MRQIWSNPSFERGFLQTNSFKSELVEYLSICMKNGNCKTRNISVFPGFEYTITFYDVVYATLRTVKALVTDVYEDQIKVKYVPDETTDTLNCNKCKNKCNKTNEKTPPMPTCNCVLNPPPVDKYKEPITYFIPLSNIVDIQYVMDCSRPNFRKGDVYVMLLGISATVVKSIIVRLEFFDDSIQDAIKLVELEAGGIYNITYEGEDGAIYESKAKVIKIEQDRDTDCKCKPGKGYIRENVGGGNIVYTCSSKSDFMNNPPVKEVRIIVDTSEDFSGRYETILLHSIRDCTLIQAPDGSEPDVPEINPDIDPCCSCCENKTPDCTPKTCGCYHPVKDDTKCCTYNYHLKNDNTDCTATVSGEKVTMVVDGNEVTSSLEDLLKFYLGIE